MLRREQALRDDLDALNASARAMSQHAEYDRELSRLGTACKTLTESFAREHAELIELGGARLLKTIQRAPVAELTSLRQQAESRFAVLEEAQRELETLVKQFCLLIRSRASLGVVPVDRDDQERRIQKMEADLFNMAASVERHRQWILSDDVR